MRSAVLALLALVTLALPAGAALDPELTKPYHLQIVLHIADNRALTPLFQEELQQALSDQLRQTFGALAEVKVLLAHHPLLAEIAAKGLEQALDEWNQAEPKQTHFVLLDYSGGQYRLQARSHDGMTGQAGAIVRRVQTVDRALVPLLAARLVEEGFAPVGTVTAVKAAGQDMDVQLTLKGGGLGVPLAPWVKAGDVFTVSRVAAPGPLGRPERIAWALLEVRETPRDGVCSCRYWRRFVRDDLRETPGTLGFRAWRLAATTGPVRLRLLDDEPAISRSTALHGAGLSARRKGARRADHEPRRPGGDARFVPPFRRDLSAARKAAVSRGDRRRTDRRLPDQGAGRLRDAGGGWNTGASRLAAAASTTMSCWRPSRRFGELGRKV